MNRKYFIGIIAAALLCLLLIFVYLWREIDSPAVKEPVIPPPLAPYPLHISGVGIAEPSTQNISLGIGVNRIVEKVLVEVGSKVKESDILIMLENQDLQASLQIQETAYKIALAKLKRLSEMPRQSDFNVAKALLDTSNLNYQFAKDQYEMVTKLSDQRALSKEEILRRKFNFEIAGKKLVEAQARYEKIKEGTWEPDLEIARLETLQARDDMNRVNTELQKTFIRSPINGTVLQLKIQPGELPPPNTLHTPVMILGNTHDMYLRVSINQLDIPYFQPKSPAIAFLQGNANISYELECVRVEPFLVDKQNLTNEITEKIDTRVLQIIYRIKPNGHSVYPGQQMDVFIESSRV